MELFDLFTKFMFLSLLAFGGGQAALPLLQRVTVEDTHWININTFAATVGFSYITPGPVLIGASFVGYLVADIPGALAATLGVFLMPWLFAVLASQRITVWSRSPWLKAFGKGATPAMIGLLGATIAELARRSYTDISFFLIAGVAFLLVSRTKVPTVAVLVGALVLGMVIQH
jgi:chromate transporter